MAKQFRVYWADKVSRYIDVEAENAEEAKAIVSGGEFDPDKMFETDVEMVEEPYLDQEDEE